MPKIKILYTIPNFRTAGSQYVLLSLFSGIDRSIFDPFISVEKPGENFPVEVPLDRQLVFQWNGNRFKDIRGFKDLLKKHQIDIVHSWDYKSNYLEAFASRIGGAKYIYTKKNNTWSRPWRLKSLFSNHIAYDNPEMKDRFFNSFILRNKITFIPHGVDIDIFKPLEKTPRETFDIGCIGNIGSNKNQLFIIEALKNLPTDVHIHFYGNEDKSYRKKLDQYILLNALSDRVHFNGFVKNEAIPVVYKSLDLFVLASLQEGFPVSLLEAMACGIPVLSSDSGGGAKYILPTENIFSLEKPSELIDKTLGIYNMEFDERKNLINLGRIKIGREYSSKKEISDYEILYKKLLKI